MSSTRTHVILPQDLLQAIDRLVGKRGRSSFLAESAWHEVKRRNLLRILSRREAPWKAADHPELQNGAVAWVEQMRTGDLKRERQRRRDR